MYWIKVQSIHIFTYETTVLYTFFPLFLNFWKPVVYLREAWPEPRNGHLICQKKFSLTFIYSYIKKTPVFLVLMGLSGQAWPLVAPLLARQVHDGPSIFLGLHSLFFFFFGVFVFSMCWFQYWKLSVRVRMEKVPLQSLA